MHPFAIPPAAAARVAARHPRFEGAPAAIGGSPAGAAA
jgi:hypothetical protein